MLFSGSMVSKQVRLFNFRMGNDLPAFFILGPSYIESKKGALEVAEQLTNASNKLGFKFVYSASFNEIEGSQGIGFLKSLQVLEEIREVYGCPIMMEVYTEEQCMVVSKRVDIVRIPPNLCKQTDLLVAAISNGKIVNVVKGEFLAPEDMERIVRNVNYGSNANIMITECGSCFGYNDSVVDMRSVDVLLETGYPIMVEPGSALRGDNTLRQTEVIARAAVAVGISGITFNVHNGNPVSANDIYIGDLYTIIGKLIDIDKSVKYYE